MNNNYKKALIFFAAKYISMAMFILTSVLSLLKAGRTSEEVAFGASLMMMASILLDVPTGYFADKNGTKLSVKVGIGFDLTSYLFFFLGLKNPFFIAPAYFLKGVGTAFGSGAMRLVVLDAAREVHGQEGLSKSSRHIQYCQRIGAFIGLAGGGALVSISPALPWVVAFASDLVALSSVATVAASKNLNNEKAIVSISSKLKEVFSVIPLLFGNVLLPITFIFMAEGLASGTDGLAYSPYFAMVLGGSEKFFYPALIILLVRLSVTPLTKKIPKDRTVQFCLGSYFIIALTFLGYGLLPGKVSSLLFHGIGAAMFAVFYVTFDLWQINLVEKLGINRATSLSALNCTKNVIGVLTAWAVGSLSLLTSPFTGIYMVAFFGILFLILASAIYRKRYMRSFSRKA